MPRKAAATPRHKGSDRANQRGLHGGDDHQPRANQLLRQFKPPDRDGQSNCGQGFQGAESDHAAQNIGHRRGDTANEIAAHDEAANVAAVVPGVPAHDEISKPSRQEDTDDGSKRQSKQIDAIIMRREQPRKNEHAQQPQQRREHVGGQIDAGLPDQHSAASPAASWGRAAGARTVVFSSIAARMVSTGVPEKDATEKATSSLSARRSS